MMAILVGCSLERAAEISRRLRRGAGFVVIRIESIDAAPPAPRRKLRRIGGSDRLWRALRGRHV